MKLLLCRGCQGHAAGGKPQHLRADGHEVVAPLMYGGWLAAPGAMSVTSTGARPWSMTAPGRP